MYSDLNNGIRKNEGRINDRIYYDDCNVLFKICGLITFVWGIMAIFGMAASIIGAGGPDEVADLMPAYSYTIVAGIAMIICGLYTYITRYIDLSIIGFLLAVLSGAMSLILIGVLARNIPAFVAIAIVPSVSSCLIAFEHARHGN